MEEPHKKQFRAAQAMIVSNVSVLASTYGDTPEFHSAIDELRNCLRSITEEENNILKVTQVLENMNPEDFVETGVDHAEEVFEEKMAKKRDYINFDKHEMTLQFESEVAKTLAKIKALQEFEEATAAKKKARADAEAEEIESE